MSLIGVQGGEGSFSEEAARIFADNNGLEPFEIEYLITSEEVLSAVENKSVEYGVFAIENAKGGVVIESIKALAGHICEIVEMLYIPISQNLLTKPGTLMGNIREIHSHPQALRQCKDFLAEHFWTRPLVEADDTAESARRLKEGELPDSTAVIAAKACAEIYGLEIIQEDIQDLKNNLTLFLGIKSIK
ncbi:MAG: prephenate dehydratase [Candidatus Marinimicrobia bacterium]|nr:prephenate dehydratase [Candidatus Neomarinimicrobiota bacterium]